MRLDFPKTGLLNWALYIVPTLLAFLLYHHLDSAIPLVGNDTASYLYFHPTRPVGYPIFLAGVHSLFGSYSIVPDLQLLLCLAGIVSVARATKNILASEFLGLVVLLASLANKPFLVLTGTLASDALSFAVLCAFAASCLVFVKQGTIKVGIVKSILSALAITIRPVNVILVAADLFLIAVNGTLSWRQKLTSSIVAILLAAAAWGATPLVHYAKYGSAEGGSPLARGLFQKAFYITPIDDQKYKDCVGEEVFGAISAARTYVEQAPPNFRRQLEYRLSDYIRFEYAMNAIARDQGVDADWKIDGSLSCYAAQAVAEKPFEIVKFDLDELASMLTLKPFILSKDVPAFEQYMKVNPPPLHAPVPLPLADAINDQKLHSDFKMPPSQPLDASYLMPSNRYGGLLVLVSSLVAILCNLAPLAAIAIWSWTKDRAKKRLLSVPIAFGLIVYGGTIITSISEFGLARYVLVYWTIMLVSLVFVLDGFCGVWRRYLGGPEKLKSHNANL